MNKSDILRLFASAYDPREGDLERNEPYRAHLERQRRIVGTLTETLDERQQGLFEAYQQEVLVDMLALSEHYFTQGCMAEEGSRRPKKPGRSPSV